MPTNRGLLAVLVLLVLGVAGCAPFVLASNTRHFATSEYSFPMADGSYAVNGLSLKSAVFTNRSDHVEITLNEDKNPPRTLIGGFVALKSPGYLIFQATDATENGKPVEKKAAETVYIPVHMAKTGEMTWFVGPKICDADCTALFSSFGFEIDGIGDWRAPENLSRSRTLAFFEALAPLLDRSPDAWEVVRTIRAGGDAAHSGSPS